MYEHIQGPEGNEEKNSLLGWGIVGPPLTCNEYFFLSLYIVLYHETAKIVLLITSKLYCKYCFQFLYDPLFSSCK